VNFASKEEARAPVGSKSCDRLRHAIPNAGEISLLTMSGARSDASGVSAIRETLPVHL